MKTLLNNWAVKLKTLLNKIKVWLYNVFIGEPVKVEDDFTVDNSFTVEPIKEVKLTDETISTLTPAETLRYQKRINILAVKRLELKAHELGTDTAEGQAMLEEANKLAIATDVRHLV